MNRLEELGQILEEINEISPETENVLQDTVIRAQKRISKRNKIIRPIATIAATFALFVGLVNFCTPVAYACSKVPFLKELAEAVTFSPSLTDAVKNEYAQEIGLTQNDGDVTATVEYLIVDQKQVNVFFRIESDVCDSTGITPKVQGEDGESIGPCSYGLNAWDVPNGELQSVTVDFIDVDVPDTMRLKLFVSDTSHYGEIQEVEVPEHYSDSMFAEDYYEEPEYIAEFDFLLHFIPGFTASGKVYALNQMVELEGQKITIENVEVYPSHLRVNVTDDENNTAWIKSLQFYVETDKGKKFETISNGITATGSGGNKSMTSFRSESSYFYESDSLKLVITGVEWLNKDMEKVYVNLKTGETGQLPEGVSFYKATKEEGGWFVEFLAKERKENHSYQLFSQTFYDKEGNEYEINSWSSGEVPIGVKGEDHFCESFPLVGYYEDEVWLSPIFSHVWTAEEPVIVMIQ